MKTCLAICAIYIVSAKEEASEEDMEIAAVNELQEAITNIELGLNRISSNERVAYEVCMKDKELPDKLY